MTMTQSAQQQRGQSWERVRLTIDPAGVADVTLDRPPANAIDLVTLNELKQVSEALTADSAVRVVMAACSRPQATTGSSCSCS